MLEHLLDRLAEDIRGAAEDARQQTIAHLAGMSCASMEDHRRHIGRLEGIDLIANATLVAIQRARAGYELDQL
jgi:hypothetical protein